MPSIVRSRPNPLLRKAVVVGLGSVTVALCTLAVTRVYAERFGASDISAVLIFRLYGSLLLACGALGMPVALQRTVAYLSGTPSYSGTAALTGLAVAMASLGIACAVSGASADTIARLLDHPAATELWRAFMLLTYGQALASMVSFIQLARGRTFESVAIALGAYGIGPLLCVLVLRNAPLPALIRWTAVLAVLAALPSLGETVKWALLNGVRDVGVQAKTLLRYGLPRVPASALEYSLDLVLPWMAVISGAGLVGAGSLAIGLALMRPLNPISGALSQVSIPAAASSVARKEFDAQSARVRQVAQWALHGGVFATFQMVVWTDVLVRLWLGPDYVAAARVAAIVCLSLAPSFLFACLRGLIDGETERPVNTVNLCIAVCVFIAGATVLGRLHLGGVATLGLAYLVSRLVLAALTLRYVNEVHHIGIATLRPMMAVTAGALLGVSGLGLRVLVPERYLVIEMLAFVPLAAIVFTVILAMSGIEWTRSLRRMLWATT